MIALRLNNLYTMYEQFGYYYDVKQDKYFKEEE